MKAKSGLLENCLCILYHYDLRFSHASQPDKKNVSKNRQNSKENLSAISVTENREPKVAMV